jgi:hypothetical protein
MPHMENVYKEGQTAKKDSRGLLIFNVAAFPSFGRQPIGLIPFFPG